MEVGATHAVPAFILPSPCSPPLGSTLDQAPCRPNPNLPKLVQGLHLNPFEAGPTTPIGISRFQDQTRSLLGTTRREGESREENFWKLLRPTSMFVPSGFLICWGSAGELFHLKLRHPYPCSSSACQTMHGTANLFFFFYRLDLVSVWASQESRGFSLSHCRPAASARPASVRMVIGQRGLMPLRTVCRPAVVIRLGLLPRLRGLETRPSTQEDDGSLRLPSSLFLSPGPGGGIDRFGASEAGGRR